MNAEVFLDTNIVIYAYSAQETDKFEAANRLIDAGKAVISIQVLNELTVTLMRKFGLTWPQISAIVAELTQRCAIAPLTVSVVQSAIQLAERYGYRYYDCLILATALERGCSVVFSEDMQHGQVIAGRISILNPFLV